ncbi:hypothetical protein [Pseudonocardia sp. TRM90224]|uniref:hypothetical protein n=1 Tax=Pseudonocardia sp. TRM90224 TaxID=2812678 RepID=UPI001E4A66C9|nr:hypothetical protein [Pseudonocardia sp. TRM90224]
MSAPAPARPARPALTTPPHLRTAAQHSDEQRRLAGQPWLGLAGLGVVAVVFVLVAFGAGGAEASLRLLGPIATCALPVVGVIAFWWEDWPGSSLRPGWSALTDTAVAVVAGVVFTVVAQVVVGSLDGLLVPDSTFPATMPVAGAAFVAMLQLTLVSEGGSLRRLPRIAAGVAALAVSWVAAVLCYQLVAAGLVPAPELGAWLIVVGAWQAVLFVALRGWPFAQIRRTWVRVAAGNAAVLVPATLMTLALRAAGWSPAVISAATGCIIAAALLVAMLFDHWPPSRAGTVLVVGVLSAALYGLLAAIAGGLVFGVAEPVDWIAHAALNGVALGVVLHVAVWRRWPLRRSPVA